MADVSVIIPCFNAAPTLEATIESVLTQQGVSFELILVDDGSTDNTLDICRAFQAHAIVLTGPNKGVSAARNRGIAQSTSPWIKFLDADDLLLPGILAVQFADANQQNASVSICDWVNVNIDGTPADGAAPDTLDWDKIARDSEVAFASTEWAPPAAVLYSRSLVERIGGFREDLPVVEDARFLFDAARSAATFVHTVQTGVQYRVSQNSLSRRDDHLFAACCLTNAQQIQGIWQERGELTAPQIEALAATYNFVARSFFGLADPGYFQAIEAQKALNIPLPLHARLATPIARRFGLPFARSCMGVFGR